MSIKRILHNEYIVFAPLLIVYCLLVITYNFLYVDILKFILFQLLFILLPGFLFSELFISIRLNNISKMILGIPISFAVLFILSIGGKSIGFIYLPILLILVSIISIYKIIKQKKKVITKTSIYININIIAFYSLCVSLFFILFTLSVHPPSLLRYGLYYQDSLWTVGNTWSVLRFLGGGSLVDSRFIGLPFSYHMLQNFYQANLYLFTGIDPFNIHFYLEPLFDWFIIISIFVIGGIKIAKLKIGHVIIFGVLLFFMASKYLTSGYLEHLYYNPLSMFFGFSSFILFIYIVYSSFVQKKNIDVIYFLSILLIIFSTKAHLLIIIPVSLLIIMVILKKYDRETLFIGIGVIIIIFILKITIYNGSSGTLKVQDLSIIISKINQYVDIETTKLISIKYLLYIIYAIIRTIKDFMQFLIDPIIAIGIILVFLNNKIYKYLKKINGIIIYSFIFIMISFLLKAVFVFSGGNLYFFWYSRIMLLFIIMIILYRVRNSNVLDDIKIYKLLALNIIFTLVFVILLFHNSNESILFKMYSLKYSILLVGFLTGIIFLYFFIFNKNLQSFIYSKNILRFRNIFILIIMFGLFNFYDLINEFIETDWCHISRDNKKIWDTRATVDLHEWKAMKWLKTNANSSEVFISDRRFFLHERSGENVGNFFAYSALSGLQAFAEGDNFIFEKNKEITNQRWKLINNFLGSKNIVKQDSIMKVIHADYFIQSKRFNNNNYNDIPSLKLAYSNKSVNIYKIVRNNEK
jgi:hypothetical protein